MLAELTVPFVKYVAWSTDMEHVAFLAKHAIVVANKRLGNACTGLTQIVQDLGSRGCPYSEPQDQTGGALHRSDLGQEST